MILAQVKPTEMNSPGVTGEKFLMLFACPESIKVLSKCPFEILSLWICATGFPMERVQEITNWPVQGDDEPRRLVLRCESGRMWGIDDEGARHLPPSSAMRAES